jgi:hypothetical protein
VNYEPKTKKEIEQMNRTHALMTLLMISLVAGPFLFIVPSVYAAKPIPPPTVIVRIDANELDPGLISPEGNPWTDWFVITLLDLDDIPFPDPSWKSLGDIYDVTVDSTLPDPNDPNVPSYATKLDAYLNDGQQHEVEILLLLANKYKNKLDGLYIIQYAQFCDFDGDGEVTGHDSRMISTHMNNPGTYKWEYDLNYDGDITPADIHIADTFKGTFEQWITLPIPSERLAIIDSNPYLIAELWHFSGFGIRR